MHTLALYKPRFFIIEAGGSFDLLADYCASLGLSVNKVKIRSSEIRFRSIRLHPD